MSFIEKVKNASKELTITGKLCLLPLFYIVYGVDALGDAADRWLTAIGKFFNKLFFK